MKIVSLTQVLTLTVRDGTTLPSDTGLGSVTPGVPRTIRISAVVVISKTWRRGFLGFLVFYIIENLDVA